jgi:1,2-beta-oligoglucan phosphorylase
MLSDNSSGRGVIAGSPGIPQAQDDPAEVEMAGHGVFSLVSDTGLTAEVQAHGSMTWLTYRDMRINLYPASGVESGPANLWLRRLDGDRVEVHPLLGPASGSWVGRHGRGGLQVRGSWAGLDYVAILHLVSGEIAWTWRLDVTNGAGTPAEVDAVLVQDVALTSLTAVRTNEYYVCQYLDVTPLLHGRDGTALAVRQNQPTGAGTPWLLVAGTEPAPGWASDGLQVYGTARRDGRPPAGLLHRRLPSTRLQHEHTMLALQSTPSTVGPGQAWGAGFVGLLVPDHPAPTTDADRVVVDRAVTLGREAGTATDEDGEQVVPTLFDPATVFPSRDLDEAEARAHASGTPAHEERGDDGSLLSFFSAPDDHVVLRRKELLVTRPHAHLLRTGHRLEPDASSLTATTTMGGLVASNLTQGHVGRNRLLSVGRSYLGLHRAAGLRVFVEDGARWVLLDLPSAYRMGPCRAQWLYRSKDLAVEVTTTAQTEVHAIDVEVRVVDGGPRRVLVAAHLAVGEDDDGMLPGSPEVVVGDQSVTVRPDPAGAHGGGRTGRGLVVELGRGTVGAEVGDDGPLFADGRSRDLPWLTMRTRPLVELALRLVGTLVPETADPAPAGAANPAALTGSLDLGPPPGHVGADRLRHFLPWLVHDALVHYLSPRGIEQYNGGAWGTRDVCQGPVELLLALDRPREVRALLLRVFAAQQPDGSWPQAFEIHPPDAGRGLGEAHGDVVFWPVLALGRYLLASGDGGILDDVVGFAQPSATAAAAAGASLQEHAQRAVDRFTRLVVDNTHLSAYGHGDWNDSLQPADPAVAASMTSSWTVTLHHQTLLTFAAGLSAVGREHRVPKLRNDAEAVLADFRRLLLPDGVLAGYALLDSTSAPRYLLHPRDADTGLTYSLLPIIHALAENLLTAEEAERHLRLLDEHLLLPDGAHLFDRPPRYSGGLMTHFRRAETATFVGREIGTMYMHAHLRYAEAMARVGRPDALWRALTQANPIGVTEVVPGARPRQACCFFSSSDACFPDRATASADWDLARRGSVGFEGGWRVYSSGPGIMVRIVVECLLGLRRRRDRLEIDPVLPDHLDGLAVTLPVAGRRRTVRFTVGPVGYGPTAVRAAGAAVSAVRLDNPYRTGGVAVTYVDLDGADEVAVDLP